MACRRIIIALVSVQYVKLMKLGNVSASNRKFILSCFIIEILL